MNLRSSRIASDWASPSVPSQGCCCCRTPCFAACSRIQQQQQQLKFIVPRTIFTDSVVASVNIFQQQPQQKMKDNNVGCCREEFEVSAAAATSSESGWTTYLDQSQSLSKRLRRSSFSKTGNGLDSNQSSLVEDREDPSMASDASSGPKFQGCAQKKSCKRARHIEVVAQQADQHRDDDLEDTCQSNLSCESVSDESRSNRRNFFKRRKTSHKNLQASEIGDGHSDENDVEIESGEAEISSHPTLLEDIRRDAVNSRLEALQHLIPNSGELDEEQVLEVAINYVKSLEKKIKMFETKNINAFAEASSVSFQSALQDKGWCLMPIRSVVDNLGN